jgi:hypothetical protein
VEKVKVLLSRCPGIPGDEPALRGMHGKYRTVFDAVNCEIFTALKTGEFVCF